ncbi:MAG TPA: dTDP-4-dehydrorhamnose reductase [Candidatus Aminicenantes bacterium]|nr:dTDP-4-dehydrorhamnose reductase [Candidatus Aminicenantes bacterium]
MSERPGIWLVGAAGMLGRQLAGEFAARGIPVLASDREVDVRDAASLEAFARKRRIGWIVNCAAYTAVDRAEDEPAAAFAVNATGTENLARLAARLEAKLVHFSTDYVFAGDRAEPYREDDEPRPLSVYGRSKLEGERRLALCLERFFLFRVSWLYGVHGANFVHAMLRVFRERDEARVVDDQFGSPTYAGQLAANVAGLVASGSERFGVYHYCDEGVVSWRQFAAAIQELALRAGMIGRAIPIAAVATAAYGARAPRPLHAVLDRRRVQEELGFAVRPWRSNLEDFFREKAFLEGGRP